MWTNINVLIHDMSEVITFMVIDHIKGINCTRYYSCFNIICHVLAVTSYTIRKLLLSLFPGLEHGISCSCIVIC